MLSSVLNKNQKIEIMEPKYQRVLYNFGEIFKNIKQKKKHPFIKAFKDAGFSKSECRSFGFDCGKMMWSTCDNTCDRDPG